MAKKSVQSETVNQYEESRLQKMQQDLQKREQELNADLQKMNAQSNERTFKVVKEAIKTVADKKGFQLCARPEQCALRGWNRYHRRGDCGTTEVGCY